ncbi:MAG: HpcH/HpaI aldolase/citrate lyase family protein [Candidatus Gastranaerophilales bacterium]|nr:HpcH/HpaI aldolase/citrate lyase family protein [Candidatus Gastranaerophilales bacterium]
MKDHVLYYSVGPLLYCPANKTTIAQSITQEKFGRQFSLALCLEDTINDNFVAQAEQDLLRSLRAIYYVHQDQDFFLPKIFIRVRNSNQINMLVSSLKECSRVVTGFIIPKFSPQNADDYINRILEVNELSEHRFFVMPIYESASMIDLRTRYDVLYSLKDSLRRIEELVLNIRVGGNDLCHIFGFRRHLDESIHNIKPVSSIFTDIMTVYGSDYVISAPVWEYYGGDGWKTGLMAEIQDDKLCGFTGKTVIHPKQIEVVNACYRVPASDYHDAQNILGWDKNAGSFVSGNHNGERMNEYKTHLNWARRILYLAEVYGVQESAPT